MMLRLATSAALVALLGAAPAPRARVPAQGQAAAPFRLVLSPAGTSASWRVRERLVSFDFPNDAVGTTHDVGGAVVVGPDWQPVARQSKITVNLTTLQSDRAMRDRYIQHRTLQTDQYPTAVLVPTQFLRMRTPLPDTGTFTFEIQGNLTIHGITKQTTWLVTAVAKDGGFSGSALTRVTFEDFNMQQPQVPILLSIEDEINLELQFNFVRDTTWHG
jgi:polyisoprenoid-binding protein YceI